MAEEVKKNAEDAADVAENENNENKEVNMEEAKNEGVKQGEEVAKAETAVPVARKTLKEIYNDARKTPLPMVDADALKTAAKACAAIASKNAVMPMFEFMEFWVEGAVLTLRAANGESALQVRVNIENPGEVKGIRYIACRKAAQIADALNGDVTFWLGDYEVGLAANLGKTLFRLNGSTDMWQDDMFDEYNLDDGDDALSIKADALLTAFNAVKSCMSTDETRRQINGVCLTLAKEGGEGETAATDGSTLAVWQLQGECIGKEARQLIVSSRSVAELCAVLKGLGKADVKVTCNSSTVKFDMGDVVYTTKLVAGNYPNYRQVVPDTSKLTNFQFKAQDFKRAINGASLFSTDLKLTFGDTLGIDAGDGGGDGTFSTTIPCTGYVGYEPITASFGIDRLNRPLAVLSGEDAEMMVSNAHEPALFIEGSYMFLIMPMRG